MQNSGGFVQAASEVGQGSVGQGSQFSGYLPAAGGSVARSKPQQQVQSGNGKRVCLRRHHS